MTVVIHPITVSNRKKIETDKKPTRTLINEYTDHKEGFNLTPGLFLIECTIFGLPTYLSV